jgi:FtsP/CotA-like multicopper oxidase with cupredoxin domain
VQLIPIGGTMSIAFVPTQPGNWVFHCHFADHVGAEVSLAGSPRDSSEIGQGHGHDPAAGHRMRGLVLGLHVTPTPTYAAGAPPVAPRALRLLAQKSPALLIGNNPAYGFVLQRGDSLPPRDSVALPGPVLELERGKPVRITVVNHLDEPTGVHWHGLEIESFPDGVPGWSGMGARIMPPIMPNDSFVAEFTPPRAGTFLYHSHAHETRQIGSGMYGAIVVTDAPRDTTRDHLVIAGGGGPPPFEKQAAVFGLVNGRRAPLPLRLRAGVSHRFRLVSIDGTQALEFVLANDSVTARWRAVAKDGADLPAALAVEGLARVLAGTGETYDFEWTPPAPGAWHLDVRGMRAASWLTRLPIMVEAGK